MYVGVFLKFEQRVKPLVAFGALVLGMMFFVNNQVVSEIFLNRCLVITVLTFVRSLFVGQFVANQIPLKPKPFGTLFTLLTIFMTDEVLDKRALHDVSPIAEIAVIVFYQQIIDFKFSFFGSLLGRNSLSEWNIVFLFEFNFNKRSFGLAHGYCPLFGFHAS